VITKISLAAVLLCLAASGCKVITVIVQCSTLMLAHTLLLYQSRCKISRLTFVKSIVIAVIKVSYTPVKHLCDFDVYGFACRPCKNIS